MNDIKIGQLYQHIPTGIVRRVVFVGSDRVTFKEDATFTYFYCNIDDFKKFWKPYKSPPYANKRYMIDIKNIKGKLYQNILMGVIGEVVYANNDRITFKKKNSSEYFYCDMEDFLKYWQPYEASNDKVNHPSHYTWLKDLCGIEVIDITRHMDFNLGNSIKYILRSGHKKEEGYTDKQKTIEDLKKAIWYLNDEIKLLSNE